MPDKLVWNRLKDFIAIEIPDRPTIPDCHTIWNTKELPCIFFSRDFESAVDMDKIIHEPSFFLYASLRLTLLQEFSLTE